MQKGNKQLPTTDGLMKDHFDGRRDFLVMSEITQKQNEKKFKKKGAEQVSTEMGEKLDELR